jgi:hypothetical protein
MLYFHFQFHQTLKTYLNDRVWEFYFYVSKSWPETRVCMHFPGMTISVRANELICETEQRNDVE